MRLQSPGTELINLAGHHLQKQHCSEAPASQQRRGPDSREQTATHQATQIAIFNDAIGDFGVPTQKRLLPPGADKLK